MGSGTVWVLAKRLGLEVFWRLLCRVCPPGQQGQGEDLEEGRESHSAFANTTRPVPSKHCSEPPWEPQPSAAVRFAAEQAPQSKIFPHRAGS